MFWLFVYNDARRKKRKEKKVQQFQRFNFSGRRVGVGVCKPYTHSGVSGFPSSALPFFYYYFFPPFLHRPISGFNGETLPSRMARQFGQKSPNQIRRVSLFSTYHSKHRCTHCVPPPPPRHLLLVPMMFSSSLQVHFEIECVNRKFVPSMHC